MFEWLNGLGSEIGFLNALVLFILVVLLFRTGIFDGVLKKKKNRTCTQLNLKTNQGNPNGGPGKAKECIDRGKVIARIETNLENLKEENEKDHERIEKNNRDDHKRIFDILDNIRTRR